MTYEMLTIYQHRYQFMSINKLMIVIISYNIESGIIIIGVFIRNKLEMLVLFCFAISSYIDVVNIIVSYC